MAACGLTLLSEVADNMLRYPPTTKTVDGYFDSHMKTYNFVDIRSFAAEVFGVIFQTMTPAVRRKISMEFNEKIVALGLIPRTYEEFPLLFSGHQLHNRQYIFTAPKTKSPENHLPLPMLSKLMKFHRRHNFQHNFYKMKIGLHIATSKCKDAKSARRIYRGGMAAKEIDMNETALFLFAEGAKRKDPDCSQQMAIHWSKAGGDLQHKYYISLVKCASACYPSATLHYASYLILHRQLNDAYARLCPLLEDPSSVVLADANNLVGHIFLALKEKKRARLFFTKALDLFQKNENHRAYKECLAKIMALGGPCR